MRYLPKNPEPPLISTVLPASLCASSPSPRPTSAMSSHTSCHSICAGDYSRSVPSCKLNRLLNGYAALTNILHSAIVFSAVPTSCTIGVAMRQLDPHTFELD